MEDALSCHLALDVLTVSSKCADGPRKEMDWCKVVWMVATNSDDVGTQRGKKEEGRGENQGHHSLRDFSCRCVEPVSRADR